MEVEFTGVFPVHAGVNRVTACHEFGSFVFPVHAGVNRAN